MNECDHIIGYNTTHHQIVKESMKNYYLVHIKWSFCPDCGVKLDERV